MKQTVPQPATGISDSKPNVKQLWPTGHTCYRRRHQDGGPYRGHTHENTIHATRNGKTTRQRGNKQTQPSENARRSRGSPAFPPRTHVRRHLPSCHARAEKHRCAGFEIVAAVEQAVVPRVQHPATRHGGVRRHVKWDYRYVPPTGERIAVFPWLPPLSMRFSVYTMCGACTVMPGARGMVVCGPFALCCALIATRSGDLVARAARCAPLHRGVPQCLSVLSTA